MGSVRPRGPRESQRDWRRDPSRTGSGTPLSGSAGPVMTNPSPDPFRIRPGRFRSGGGAGQKTRPGPLWGWSGSDRSISSPAPTWMRGGWPEKPPLHCLGNLSISLKTHRGPDEDLGDGCPNESGFFGPRLAHVEILCAHSLGAPIGLVCGHEELQVQGIFGLFNS